MGLLDNIANMRLGYGGVRPTNFSSESKTSTLHYQSSTIGDPSISRNSSILDEKDALNKNKFKSNPGKKYNDKLPK
jgi:hypothetical protein